MNDENDGLGARPIYGTGSVAQEFLEDVMQALRDTPSEQAHDVRVLALKLGVVAVHTLIGLALAVNELVELEHEPEDDDENGEGADQ